MVVKVSVKSMVKLLTTPVSAASLSCARRPFLPRYSAAFALLLPPAPASHPPCAPCVSCLALLCPSTVSFVICSFLFSCCSFVIHFPSSVNFFVSLLFAAFAPLYARIVPRFCSSGRISLPCIPLPSFQINPRLVLAFGCCYPAWRGS